MPPATWPVPEPAPAIPNQRVRPPVAFLLFCQAQQVSPEFFGVEAHTEILHPEDAACIDDRSEKRVVDVAVLGLRREHAVPASHVANDVRGTGNEKPAGRIGTE